MVRLETKAKILQACRENCVQEYARMGDRVESMTFFLAIPG